MTLNEELKAAGLLSISELMNGQPTDAFQVHAGVNDLASFKQWLDMRTEEMLKMKARMMLDKREDSDLYEWVLSHCAVFNEVRVNLNAAVTSGQKYSSNPSNG